MYRPSDLRAGDVLLMTQNPRESLPARALDALIAWSTANPFVHAAIVGNGHIIDPLWHVEHAPLDRYAANGWVYRVDAPPAARQDAVTWAEAHVGQAYGIVEILADGLFYDAHIGLYRFHPHRLTCSAFVARCCEAAGAPLTRQPLPSPASLSYSPLLVGPRPWDRITAPPSGGGRA